jgi:hypothetical protein
MMRSTRTTPQRLGILYGQYSPATPAPILLFVAGNRYPPSFVSRGNSPYPAILEIAATPESSREPRRLLLAPWGATYTLDEDLVPPASLHLVQIDGLAPSATTVGVNVLARL